MITLCDTRTAAAAAMALKAVLPLPRLLKLALRRFSAFGAAQPQFKHDYSLHCYYDEDDEEPSSDHRLDATPMIETDGGVAGRGVQWVFMGSPRARKHLYAGIISRLLEVPHISMASLVRQELSPRSSLYKQIADAVNNGKLVPEEIIFGLLSKRLEDGYYRGESGFILDGIPRTHVQAEILDQLAEIDLVLNFKCKDLLWHGQREGPWKQKLQAYAEQIESLEDYYRKQRKLLDFRVSGTPAETWRGLLTILHLQHMNAIESLQKLTTGKSSWP